MAKYLDTTGAQHLVNNCKKIVKDSADEIKASITDVYHFKGTVENYADLPAAESNKLGDVYNVTNADPTNNINAGDNVAWNGTAWDNLSGIVSIDLSDYPNEAITAAEIDAMFASTTE